MTEAAAAAEQLRQGLAQIATAAEEAAGASHESLGAVTSLAAAFSQARELADASRRRAETLQSLIAESSLQVDASVSAVAVNAARQLDSVQVISALEAQAGAIGEITRSVAALSDQTNLLALNAAIEAARAGDEGRGFAVVADEVRALAETAEKRSTEVGEFASAIGDEVRVLAERLGAAARTAASEAEAGRSVSRELTEIRRDIEALAEGSQAILAAAAEAEIAAREAQRGAETISSAAEEQSAAAEEAQRAVQQQASALQESDATAHALAEAADDLRGAATDRAQDVGAAAEELSAAVQELSGAAAEILTAIDQISRGAEAQAASTQQSTAAINEIERAAIQTRDAAQSGLERAQAIQARIAAGRAAATKLADGVGAALVDTRASLERAAELEDAGRRIDKLVDAIALIAVQTTMLALSGSVEAARAGAAGRGFANVSNDIRALARESADNAERVKDVVYAVQRQIAAVRRDLEIIISGNESEVEKNLALDRKLATVETDIEALRKASTDTLASVERIIETARQVSSATGQIAAAAEESAGAATQAAVAARQQARGAEDLAAAIEEIAELADALQSQGS